MLGARCTKLAALGLVFLLDQQSSLCYVQDSLENVTTITYAHKYVPNDVRYMLFMLTATACVSCTGVAVDYFAEGLSVSFVMPYLQLQHAA